MTKKVQKTPVKKTQIVEITIKRTFEVPEGTEILKNKKHGKLMMCCMGIRTI